MNYYVKTQAVLAANARQSAAQMAYMAGLRGLGQGAGLPAGSTLTYSATFSVPMFSWSGTDLDTVVQKVSSQLAPFAIRMLGKTTYQSGKQWAVTLSVLTMSDRNAPSDVQSILDGLLGQQGASSIASSIAVVSTAAAAPTTPPQPPSSADFGQWVADNWPWLVLAGLGFYVVSEAL